MSFPAKTRKAILERDGHRCQECGIDCRLVARIRKRLAALERLRPWPFILVGERWYRPLEAFWLKAVGWKKPGTSYAEVDHVLPTEAGGGDEAGNGRTLCAPCHEASTAAYASLRARGRRTRLSPGPKAAGKARGRWRWPKRKLRGRPFPKGKRRLRG